MKAIIGAALAAVLVAPACMAANARNPYGNVDHRNDAGNDTGDSQVDALNAAQLGGGSAYGPNTQRRAGYRQRSYYGAVYAPAPRAYYPPPPYYPAPAYAAPPGYYPPPY